MASTRKPTDLTLPIGLAIVVVLIAAVALAQRPADVGGVVVWAESHIEDTQFGDRLIITEADIEDDRGQMHRHRVEGGKVGDLELTVSNAPRLTKGRRVRLRGDQVYEANASVFGKWPIASVPYLVNATSSQRLTPDALLAAVAHAANVWPSQSQARISAFYAGPTTGTTAENNGRNEVSFRVDPDTSYVAKALVWSDGAGFVDADIIFNESYLLLAGDVPCSGGIWVEDAGAHEFGHFFGLSHSDVGAATMYPVLQYCDQNFRTLDADDIAGIEANYPPDVQQPPQEPPSTPPKKPRHRPK